MQLRVHIKQTHNKAAYEVCVPIVARISDKPLLLNTQHYLTFIIDNGSFHDFKVSSAAIRSGEDIKAGKYLAKRLASLLRAKTSSSLFGNTLDEVLRPALMEALLLPIKAALLGNTLPQGYTLSEPWGENLHHYTFFTPISVNDFFWKMEEPK